MRDRFEARVRVRRRCRSPDATARWLGRLAGTPAEGKVRAKTGTVDNVRAIAGYVETADGETLVFSIIANNFTAASGAIDAAADRRSIRLATFTSAITNRRCGLGIAGFAIDRQARRRHGTSALNRTNSWPCAEPLRQLHFQLPGVAISQTTRDCWLVSTRRFAIERPPAQARA